MLDGLGQPFRANARDVFAVDLIAASVARGEWWEVFPFLVFPFPVDIRQVMGILSALSDVEGKQMKKTQMDLLQGTLDLLVLKTLQAGPTHGWDIAQRIQQVSRDVLRVGQGSLYPALHRLEAQGWISSEWGASDNNRRAKFYRLTAAGRKQLAAETESWERFTGAVDLILKTT
jgi:transcriptional regulator